MPEGKPKVMVYNVGHACQTGACGDENCECASFHNMKTSCPFAEDMPHPPAHDGCDCYMTPDDPDPPRPEGQIRMIPMMAAAFAKMGNLELYDEPIKQKDGSVAIGVWIQGVSSKVLDDSEASRIEVVVCGWGEV